MEGMQSFFSMRLMVARLMPVRLASSAWLSFRLRRPLLMRSASLSIEKTFMLFTSCCDGLGFLVLMIPKITANCKYIRKKEKDCLI